ncbi:MAG: hypothetical protein IJD40_08865 [Lachnospiraceae bacterium]|nr:hypothetical protein [Lachnospiraceae bacterium]
MNRKSENKGNDKYVQFADSVKQWNRFRIVEGMIGGLLGVVGCIIVAILEMLGAGLGIYISRVFAILFGMLIAWRHCEMYVRVDGKENRLNQYIHDIPLFVAFSFRDYYKEIERRLWKKTMIVSGIVFVILFTMSIMRLFTDFLGVMGFCIITVVVMDAAIVASFFLLRYFDMRSFAACIEKGKSKKIVSQKKESFWYQHRVLLVLLCSALPWVAFMLSGVRNYILRVPDDIEVYRAASDWFISVYGVVMCAIFGGEQIGKLVTKKGGSIKQALVFSVVAVMALGYGCTYYTTYYEDKIVANRFFITKEYTWDEVQSYTVKPKWISGILQLELEMEDRTLWVISSDNICSEKHCDVYYSDYEYIAHLVEKMNDYGIDGTIEKEEKIAPNEEMHDLWDMEAFDRIKTIVYDLDE